MFTFDKIGYWSEFKLPAGAVFEGVGDVENRCSRIAALCPGSVLELRAATNVVIAGMVCNSQAR